MGQRGGNGDKTEKDEESSHESRENQSAGRVVLARESGWTGGRKGWVSQWVDRDRKMNSKWNCLYACVRILWIGRVSRTGEDDDDDGNNHQPSYLSISIFIYIALGSTVALATLMSLLTQPPQPLLSPPVKSLNTSITMLISSQTSFQLAPALWCTAYCTIQCSSWHWPPPSLVIMPKLYPHRHPHWSCAQLHYTSITAICIISTSR